MSTFTGAGGLARLILRRDRFLMPLWILVLAVLPASYTASMVGLFPTEAARQAYAQGTAGTPAIVALTGPLYGSSAGALGTQRAGTLVLILSLISVLTVIRHTRTEEEAGRRELLGATVVGRHAALTAALIVTCAASLTLGIFAALGVLSQGQPAAGSLAFGLALALTGCVFATVGGIAAQLTENAGGARGLGLGVLAVAFLLRMAGDVGGEDGGTAWLSWLSPIGWGQHIRAFGGERWWVLALSAALTAVLVAVAYPLASRRDVGAGLLPASLGPVDASPRLRGPLGLAWRLHRVLMLGWVIGFAAMGAVLGSSADAALKAVEDTPALEDVFKRLGGGAAFADAYLAAIMSLLAMAASGYAIQAALRMRSEEAALRSEPVLSGAVSRLRWAGSHLTFAILGPALALTVGGLTAGLVYGANTGDVGRELPRVLGAAIVQSPAVWALAAVAVLLFGLRPQWSAGAWAALGVCVILGQLGAILELSQAVLDISPFTHIPKIPSVDLTVTPLIWLMVVAAALAAAGLAAFRRRDVPVT